MKRNLGAELYRTQFTVCTQLENGRTYLRQWLLRELTLFAAQLFYDAVEKYVARVVVVNTSQFKIINQSVKATDKNDAELLAAPSV